MTVEVAPTVPDTPEALMNIVIDFPELRLADRCDYPRCGAQAFVITKHRTGVLYWCGHHYADQQTALISDGDRPQAIGVSDHRATINKPVRVPATV